MKSRYVNYLRNAMVILFMSYTIVFAAKMITSFVKTADAQITNEGCRLRSVMIVTDGTNPATLVIYDSNAVGNNTASNKVYEHTVVGANLFGGRTWTGDGLYMEAGIYGDVSGTGANYYVEYEE